jgi:hypothetical protein
MCVHRATATLPSELSIAPVSGLRADLRHEVLSSDEDAVPDWSTLRVLGPFERFSDTGQVVFEYQASVQCQNLRELLHQHASV